MSKITEETISQIADLARIEMNENEKKEMAKSFGPILEMVDRVNEVDLGEEITRNFRLKNIMRDDKLRDDSSENKEEVLGNFPEKKDNYLKTKKILEN
jgi:aspartyl-tRNA(Asn)/glutamyl-tRNA(Gln) amidotransferase subunit C